MYGVVPLWRLLGSRRSSRACVRRCRDVVLPEIVSDLMRQRLTLHGVVADRSMPTPASNNDGGDGLEWQLAEEEEDIDENDPLAEGSWGESRPSFTGNVNLEETMAIDPQPFGGRERHPGFSIWFRGA